MPDARPTRRAFLGTLALAALALPVAAQAPRAAPPADAPASDSFPCEKCKRLITVGEDDDFPERCPHCGAPTEFAPDGEGGGGRRLTCGGLLATAVGVVVTLGRVGVWFYRNRSVTGKPPDKRDPMYLRRQELLAEAEVHREIRGGRAVKGLPPAPTRRVLPGDDAPPQLADAPDDDAPAPAPKPVRKPPPSAGFELVEDSPRRPAPPRRPPPSATGFELVEDGPPPPRRARVVPPKPTDGDRP